MPVSEYDLALASKPAADPYAAALLSSGGDAFDAALTGVQPQQPAKAGFFESLSGVPEELGRFLMSGTSREMSAREVQRQAELSLKSEAGDLAAAKKLRSKGIAASTVASLVPVGGPAVGAGRVLLSGLARRAAYGAGGGALAGGAEAAVSGEDIVPAAASGALLGGVVGGSVAGVGSLLARRAAERLAKSGKAATPELALEIARQAEPASNLPEYLRADMAARGLRPDRMLHEVDVAQVRGLLDDDPMLAALARHNPELAARARTGNVTLAEMRNAFAKIPAAASSPVDRVLAALKAAPRLLGKQEALRTAERGVRVARAKETAAKTAGEAGFHSELKNLAGELPRVDFATLRTVVAQEDIDALNEMVKRQPGFDFFDTVHAREGLAKLFGEFGGSVPSESELKLLNKVFGEDFVRELQSKRPVLNRLHQAGIEVLGLSRSLMSTLDLSAPRQASFAIFSNPKQAIPNMRFLFQHLASQRAFQASQDEIAARPTYELMKRGKLELTEVGPILSEREELFKSSLAERIPLIGPLIKGSNRAFTGYLNRVRADIFDDFVKNAQRAGRNVWRDDAPAVAALQRVKQSGEAPTEALLKDAAKESNDLLFSRRVAHFVNAATGRGDLPRWLEKNANEMTVTFFAPRYMSAHLTIMNPMTYIRQDPQVRKAAIRGLLGFAGTALGVMKLAEFAGATVDNDTNSPDWGKIRFGNTRYDILGGYQQYLRTGARLLTQWQSGEDAPENLRQNAQQVVRFGRTKLSPLASFAADFYFGKDMKGKDVSFDLDQEFLGGEHPLGPGGIVGSRFIPLILQDTNDAMQEWGPAGAAVALPGYVGVGVQTYR